MQWKTAWIWPTSTAFICHNSILSIPAVSTLQTSTAAYCCGTIVCQMHHNAAQMRCTDKRRANKRKPSYTSAQRTDWNTTRTPHLSTGDTTGCQQHCPAPLGQLPPNRWPSSALERWNFLCPKINCRFLKISISKLLFWSILQIQAPQSLVFTLSVSSSFPHVSIWYKLLMAILYLYKSDRSSRAEMKHTNTRPTSTRQELLQEKPGTFHI